MILFWVPTFVQMAAIHQMWMAVAESQSLVDMMGQQLANYLGMAQVNRLNHLNRAMVRGMVPLVLVEQVKSVIPR